MSKVLLAYVVADGLFLLMGVFMIVFSVIVQNIQFEIPTEGHQAARNLLYQRFPLTGECLHVKTMLNPWFKSLTE